MSAKQSHSNTVNI